ncbi:MAG: NfeD family protein [Gordonia sp. (in: high G+C Gram-positive bacteria)]
MAAVLWFVGMLALLIGEMISGDLVLLMLAGGALAAGGTELLVDLPIWADCVVFGVVSLLLLGTVRPVAKRHLMSRPRVLTNSEALEGKPAIVTARVDARDGRVKIGGDVWSARVLTPGDVFEPGDQVTVMQIDGATAVVWKG